MPKVRRLAVLCLAVLSLAVPMIGFALPAASDSWRGTITLERTITESAESRDAGSSSQLHDVRREIVVATFSANGRGQYVAQMDVNGTREERSHTARVRWRTVLSGCDAGATEIGDLFSFENDGRGSARFALVAPSAWVIPVGFIQTCISGFGCQVNTEHYPYFIDGQPYQGVTTAGARVVAGSESWREDRSVNDYSILWETTLTWDLRLDGSGPAPASTPLPGFGACDGALGALAELPPPDPAEELGEAPDPVDPPAPPPEPEPPALAGDDGVCPYDMAAAPDDAELTCLCPATAIWGGVWGTGIYTDDSAVCAAARHAGVLPPTGGRVSLRMAPGCEAYEGTDRNGVVSEEYGSWSRSFTFNGGPGSC